MCSGYAITPPIGWLYPTWPSARIAARTASPASAQRASCWTARSSTSPRTVISGRVLGIDPHVLVAQVAEEDLGLGAVAGEADDVLDLLPLDRGRERVGVVAQRHPRGADLHALDRDCDRKGGGAGEGSADRLGDAAPVRIAPVQRGLHQGRVRDRAGGGLDVRHVPAADDDAADALGAFAVADDHQREAAQDGVERLAEAHLVLGLGLDADAARAAALQDRRVVGRELAVDADALERAFHADAEEQ